MKFIYKNLKNQISEILINYFNESYSVKFSIEEILSLISETKDYKNGDFCIPLFIIAKNLNKNPFKLSNQIADYLIEISKKKEDNKYEIIYNLIDKIEPVGPYINFWINKRFIFSNLILNSEINPFHFQTLKNHTVVLDYSSCNIAKPYGIGHIMSTAIGESIKRCYEYLGSNVIGINYIGDWGTQFGKVLLAYQLWGDEKLLEKEGVYYLYELYVKFHQEEEKNPGLSEDAKEVFQKLEENDPYYFKLWEKFKKISLDNFNEYYKLFGNTFTFTEGESKYGKKNVEEVIRILELNQILVESEGAQVVYLDDIYPDEDIPPCIIKKSDGTTTYALRDISAVLDRWQRFHFDEALYVINVGQSLHIKQIKGVLKKLKFPFANSIYHVAFGTMSFSGQKMQTRKGTILFLKDIYNEVYSRAIEITKEKKIAQDIEDTSKKLAVGAIVFSILKNQRIKDIDFDFSKVLNFEGDTAAYLQYTAVRIKSILKKANVDMNKLYSEAKKASNKDFYDLCFKYSKNKEENNEKFKDFIKTDLKVNKKDSKDDIIEIIDKTLFEIYRFDEIIENVIKEKEPYLLSRYLLKLSMLFNQFYSTVKVIDGNDDDILLKLVFIDRIKNTIVKGLELLGIDIPQSL